MRKRSKKPSPCSRQSGMTLVEVVAGIAVLGTLLVAVLMTEAACKRQSAAAAMRLKGSRAADAMLETWWASEERIPVNDRGIVPAELGEFTWRTRPLKSKPAQALGVRIVCVEIAPTGGDRKEKAMVTVDVVLDEQNGPGLQPR